MAEGPKEAIKLCFESLKQVAILSSGAIVLIGTFLDTIFPADSTTGVMLLTPALKYLIAASFVFFGLSLAVAAIAMDLNVIVMKDIEEHRVSTRRLPLSKVTARAMAAALGLFSLGIFSFGLAVLIEVFQSSPPPITGG